MTTIWTLLAGVLAASYWRVAPDDTPRPLGVAAVKVGSVALLALAGLAGDAPWLVVPWLALGAAGDFALARPGQGWFLNGMAAFAAGHLCYAAAFVGLGAAWPPHVIVLGLAVVAASTALWLAPCTGALRLPVRGYVGVMLVMAGAAAGLPAADGVLQVGAAFFVTLDVILALGRFVVASPQARRLCAVLLWPLYWAGQARILWGGLSLAPPLA